LASIDFLETQLRDRLAVGDAVADCSEVTFVDVAGCRLLRNANLGTFGPGRLFLENTSPAVSRVMNLCNWADVAA
jgi:anti-anti-sigma regulatory factor